MKTPQYLTVKALTKYIKRKFDADPHLEEVFVKGELSNFKRHSSGHMYFTLKDDASRMAAVMFARHSSGMKFSPENGMQVLIRGSVNVYEVSGQYQLYVSEMLPDGIGELYLAYEQLKEKLGKEGLFADEKKRVIPAYPEKIAVVTSPTGAAVRDIVTTIQRRYPIGNIIIIPALVQGSGAARSITEGIRSANERTDADVLIVGRGGGSIEELWAFNEEAVARAISQSAIPVISAVGHETDFTIADFAADLRAATPTAAAELAVPHLEEILEGLLQRKARLFQGTINLVKEKRSRLSHVEQSYIFRHPRKLYEQQWQQLDRLNEQLQMLQSDLIRRKQSRFSEMVYRLKRSHPLHLLQRESERLERADRRLDQESAAVLKNKVGAFAAKAATLEALNPLKVLRRGFNVAYTDDNVLLKSVTQRETGDNITVQLVDGKLFCTINDKKEGADIE